MTWTTVYNLSLDLMGERKSDGSFSTAELAAIAVRAPALATLLQAELLPSTGGQTAVPVAALTDRVLLPDQIALSVAPWGLAALLLAESNPALAAFSSKNTRNSGDASPPVRRAGPLSLCLRCRFRCGTMTVSLAVPTRVRKDGTASGNN